MRILLIGKTKKKTRTYYHFKKAFKRQGHQVCWVKYLKLKSYLGEKIANIVVNIIVVFYRPELLFFHGKDISYDSLLRLRKKMPVVMFYDDFLTARRRNDEQLKKRGRACDIMYLTNRGELGQYRQWGINARHIAGGCDPDDHYIVQDTDPFFQSEVAFIGQANAPERVACMREIAKRFDLKLYGLGWEDVGLKATAQEVFIPEYRKICAGAKVVLGWNNDTAKIDLYFSNRTWFTLGCGGFLLTAYSPSLEEMFGRARELDWFETVEECCEKISYYLTHDEERSQIAAAGYKLAHSQYSYDSMVKKIIADIEKAQIDLTRPDRE
jgi:hypothetical protein